ncbi:hypothetical protein [Bacillus sp. JJ675]|uniref:hypothetical protein n=1 Tax=Bacillus sp. JJ675 TaxID=3122972 RepID=UPI003000829E
MKHNSRGIQALLILKETATYKHLPYSIQSHLTPFISRKTKSGIACFIVLMHDMFRYTRRGHFEKQD